MGHTRKVFPMNGLQALWPGLTALSKSRFRASSGRSKRGHAAHFAPSRSFGSKTLEEVRTPDNAEPTEFWSG